MKPISAVLVDDDGYARDLLGSILREFECKVRQALSSGDDAIRKCAKDHPDILFLDIEMPGTNGFGTLERILQDNPDQYVVMISAHSTLDNVKKAIELGAKGFIVKPYTSAKVRDMLDKYRRDRSRTGPQPSTLRDNDTGTDRSSPAVNLEDTESSPASAGAPMTD